MKGYLPFAIPFILMVILCNSPSLGSVTGRKTAKPRESYVRIFRGNADDFCIARPQDIVVYCASYESVPSLCSNASVNFTSKIVTLQGPEGNCVGLIDGEFNGEALFDRSKMLQRLPVLYGDMEYCPAYYENGKWIEFEESGRDDVFRAPRNPQPVSSSYHRSSAPWVKFNVVSEPDFLCVGRNGSQKLFCSRNPRERANCAGSSFINFDYSIILYQSPRGPCNVKGMGYYDMVVDVKSMSEVDNLPVYDIDPGEPCTYHGVADGAQENPCSFDGRRCRP